MTRETIRRLGLATAFVAVVFSSAVQAADDSVAAARDLYASAAYEDALVVLNRLHAAGVAGPDARAIEQYRAFCLLALGRGPEAEDAIAAVVAAEPNYQPSTDVSPRIRTAFSDVRRRMLPTIIQQKYADAKSAFDRKEFARAAEGFAQVLATLSDPDVGAAASQPPLTDVRVLATGFHDLAAAAAAPPPPPPPPPAPAAPPQPVVARPDPTKIYGGSDSHVVPPITIRQVLPAFPGRVISPMHGVLEVIIGANGQVESATMRESVNSFYDTLAVGSTKAWKYQPATFDGTPVKYRKLIQISLSPGAGGPEY